MSESQFKSPLLSHYENLLNALSLYVDANGHVYSKKRGKDTPIPTVLENRRLTLPTEEMLKNPDWESTIFFHPFSESVVRGESEMVTWLKDRMTYRLTATLSIMITKLTEIAAIGDLQTKLTTDQLNTLQTFGDADEKTIENIGSIIEAVTMDNSYQLIHFYLRHSGKGGDKSSRRFAKVTFPIYTELTTEGATKIFGVNLRVKDRKFLKNVLEYIFDKIGTEDAYSYGSNSETAPYYHALINAFAKVAVPLSSRIYLFRGPLKDIVNSRIHTDGWLDTFDEAKKAAEFLYAMPFNIGMDGHGQADASPVGAPVNAKVINDTVDPIQKTNAAISNIPNAATGLRAMIDGNVQQQRPASGLNSLLNNNQVQQTVSPLAGLPTIGGTLNQQNNQMNQQPLGNPLVNGSSLGRSPLGSGGLGGLLGGSSLGGGTLNTSFGNDPFAGLPRR